MEQFFFEWMKFILYCVIMSHRAAGEMVKWSGVLPPPPSQREKDALLSHSLYSSSLRLPVSPLYLSNDIGDIQS